MSAKNNIDMKVLDKKLQELSANKFWAESTVAVTSTLQQSWEDRGGRYTRFPRVVFRKKKRANLLFKLAIVSWYVDETVGFFIRDAIYPLVQQDITLIHIKYSLISKDWMLRVLQDELRTLHPNQVFGNFLNNNEWSEEFFSQAIDFKIITELNPIYDTRSVKSQRTVGVGYNDKGTLPESWKPKAEAFQDQKLHNQIIQRRTIYQQLENEYLEWLAG